MIKAHIMVAQPSIRPADALRDAIGDADLVRQQLFIDGHCLDADDTRTFDVTNPATGASLGAVAAGGAAETRAAVAAAQRALGTWRRHTPDARGTILRRWADAMRNTREALARLMTLEQGKPLGEARGEIDYAANFLDWFAEEGRRTYGETIPSHLPGRRLMTWRQPIGVTAAITPWNFPSAMITRKVGAALAAGCPMIVRPADETPFSALALAVLAERAGVPAGVFNVVTGDAVAIATALTASDEVRALSFTGSTEVGRILLQQSAATIKRVSLELGGHAPFIVFDDMDPDVAARLAVAAKFQTTGQDCLAANRIYVQRGIYDRFGERFVAHTARLTVGNGLDPGVVIGPLISERAVVRCERQISEALARGARLRCGGSRHAAGPLFLQPTVLSEVSDDMLIGTQETFGPVAGIAPFDSEHEVTRRANATQYGLAAYVLTQDLARSLRLADQLEYGIVALNTVRFTGAPIPFGGMKQSGLGREGSRHGIDEYTQLKYVCIGVEEGLT